MTIKQPSRKINRNIFYGKLYTNGLDLKKLGQRLDPPVTKSRVCQIINRCEPTDRMQEIATILGTNIQTLWPKNEELRQFDMKGGEAWQTHDGAGNGTH